MFMDAVVLGSGTLATPSTTARDGASSQTIVTAGADGTRITEVTMKNSLYPLIDIGKDLIGLIFLDDGTNVHIFDELPLLFVFRGSTTFPSEQTTRWYDNLVLPSGWELKASVLTDFDTFLGDYPAPIAECVAMGADL